MCARQIRNNHGKWGQSVENRAIVHDFICTDTINTTECGGHEPKAWRQRQITDRLASASSKLFIYKTASKSHQNSTISSNCKPGHSHDPLGKFLGLPMSCSDTNVALDLTEWRKLKLTSESSNFCCGASHSYDSLHMEL